MIDSNPLPYDFLNHTMSARSSLKRTFRVEQLEVRRLLAGEGDLFQVQQSFPNAGLLGDVTSEIRWGDGESDPLVLSGDTSVATEGIKVVIDYSLDDNGFFNQAGAKVALQFAADVVASRFQDQLAEIKPSPPGLPGLSYRPFVLHPSRGASDQANGTETSVDSLRNVRVNANEIRLFAGGRNLRQRAGDGSVFDVAAVGGPGDIHSDPYDSTATNRMQQFKARGQAGAVGNNPTDSSLTFAQIGFNTTMDWDFSIDGESLDAQKIDFVAVAMHELAHVFGFGISPLWLSKVQSGTFLGTNARAAYQGSGSVPVLPGHWADAVHDTQPTLMTSQIRTSKGRTLSELDFAALKDLGWEVRNEGDIRFNANHRYADDGNYEPSIVLRGALGGVSVYPLDAVAIDNAPPTLTVSQPFSVPVGVSFEIDDLGVNNDPGANDTFTFQIDWGDGATTDTGNATIDSTADGSGGLTVASFNGTYVYQSAGVQTVTVTVTDKDGASTSSSFQITVTPPPVLTLSVNRSVFAENDGADAAVLTIRRSGPVLSEVQRVDLQSSDPSELSLPSFVEISAGATEVNVPIQAVDDDLLDGDQAVSILASGAHLESDELSVTVKDHEHLTVRFSSSEIIEGANGVSMRVTRSNTDITQALTVNVTGLDRSQLDFAIPVEIPAGRAFVDIAIVTVDDDIAESPQNYDIQFSAPGYAPASEGIIIVDDEPPTFQNLINRFDANQDQNVTAVDALIIINAIARHSGSFDLTPGTDVIDEVFLDVSGDYRVTALDALQVINKLARPSSQSIESETPVLDPLTRLPGNNLLKDRIHDEALEQILASIF